MADIKTVNEGLEYCKVAKCSTSCPYYHYIKDGYDCEEILLLEVEELLKEQQAESVDAFIQWCADSHMIGDATLNGIKYWVEKYKEFVSKGR